LFLEQNVSWDVLFVVAGVVVAVLHGGIAFRNIKRGALHVNEFGMPVTREESPRTFWYATGLSLAMAALGLAIIVPATGKLVGLWEFAS
jgi:hypothetical protein